MIGKFVLMGISTITEVMGVDTPWVVMSMVVSIPSSVTEASSAIRKMNLLFKGGGSPNYFGK